jgi:hypothetical protein
MAAVHETRQSHRGAYTHGAISDVYVLLIIMKYQPLLLRGFDSTRNKASNPLKSFNT